MYGISQEDFNAYFSEGKLRLKRIKLWKEIQKLKQKHDSIDSLKKEIVKQEHAREIINLCDDSPEIEIMPPPVSPQPKALIDDNPTARKTKTRSRPPKSKPPVRRDIPKRLNKKQAPTKPKPLTSAKKRVPRMRMESPSTSRSKSVSPPRRRMPPPPKKPSSTRKKMPPPPKNPSPTRKRMPPPPRRPSSPSKFQEDQYARGDSYIPAVEAQVPDGSSMWTNSFPSGWVSAPYPSEQSYMHQHIPASQIPPQSVPPGWDVGTKQSGYIYRIDVSQKYAFIRNDVNPSFATVYVNEKAMPGGTLKHNFVNERVEFELGRNYKGFVALNVRTSTRTERMRGRIAERYESTGKGVVVCEDGEKAEISMHQLKKVRDVQLDIGIIFTRVPAKINMAILLWKRRNVQFIEAKFKI